MLVLQRKSQNNNVRALEEIEAIVASILSLNLKVGVWLATICGGMTIGMISAFVNNWIYDSTEAYFALVGVIFADHLSGMYLAYKHNRFETRKATRIFWTVCSHTALLVFGSNLAKGSNALFWLDETIFVPLCLVNLISLVKNLSLLGFIKKELGDWFYRKIDVSKNEFVKKKSSGDNDADAGRQ